MAVTDDMPPNPLPRDLDRVEFDAWPLLAFPLAREQADGVPVVVRQSVLNAIHDHGHSLTQVEVCGVLIGNGYRDERGPFVYVEGSIRGEHAGSQLAQVTFTPETWTHIQDELDQKHPHLRIVGWYHTHPGFGVFLSPMDMFIHENFFNSAEQLALVYDPVGNDEGVFIWREGVPKREGIIVEPDVPAADSLSRRISSLPTTTAAAVDSPTMTMLTDLRRRQQLLTVAMTILAAIAIFWPIGLQLLWSRWMPRPTSTIRKSEPVMPPAIDPVTPFHPSSVLPPKSPPSDEPVRGSKKERNSEVPLPITAPAAENADAPSK